jgi:hypothetical protein
MAYIYRSITLADGESYVLPAGAELVGVSGSITSDANCAGTASVETLTCYIAAIGAFSNDNGNSEFGESEGNSSTPLSIQGIYQNGVYTPFIDGPSTGIGGGGCFDGISIGLAVQKVVPGVVDYSGHTSIHTSPTDNCITYVLIYTVPSLAENLYLWTDNSAPIDSGTSNVTQLLPFKTYATYENNGYSSLPTCPNSAP